jgi:GAF domain-containing protein
VGGEGSRSVAAAAERLRNATSVAQLIGLTAESLVLVLDVAACTISRVIGDLLVDLVQHRREGDPAPLGHGYLISDFPLTRAVIETREPEIVYSEDADADRAEVDLLAELGFDSLLMLAIEAADSAWALVEVYANDRRFDRTDVELAQVLVAEAGAVLEQLSRA